MFFLTQLLLGCFMLHPPCAVHSYMYDVISTTMVPPLSCVHGCAKWDTMPTSVWRNVSLANEAGTNCAQPGRAVNSKLLGAWCFCATKDAASTTPRVPADPTHPFDGMNFTLLVTGTYAAEGLNKYVSYARNGGAPPNMPWRQAWMRATEDSIDDAMALAFHAVPSKPHTYTLFSAFAGQHDDDDEKWITASPLMRNGSTGSHAFIHAWGASTSPGGALQMTLAPQGERSAEYTMTNALDGTYVSYCTDSCTSGYYLASGYRGKAGAMTVKLIPYLPLPPSDFCTYAQRVPEQINVQLAGPDSVTISFVTFDTAAPVGKPSAMFGTTPGSGTSGAVATGGTQKYETAEKDRTYYFHFVALTELKPRVRYFYAVGVGTSALRSKEFSFQAPHSHADPGATTLDVYGDMGVYEDNNMAQLYADCVASDTVSGIIHMGDHAYNEGQSDERRGDGYMSAFQPTLANCFWVPIVGNHGEFA